MAWTLKFFGLAEAATLDIRGQLTASGLLSPLLTVDSFPSQVAPFVILLAENADLGGEAELPRSANLRVEVIGPDEETLVALQQEVLLARPPVRLAGLPARAQVVAQLPVQVNKSGDYTFRVTLDFKEFGTLSQEMVLPIWDRETELASRIHS
jgi:hypothetical protein